MGRTLSCFWHEADKRLENDRIGCKTFLLLNFSLDDLQSNLTESVNTVEGGIAVLSAKLLV